MIDRSTVNQPNRRSPWVLVIFVVLIGGSAGMIGIHTNGDSMEIIIVVLFTTFAAIALYLYISKLVGSR